MLGTYKSNINRFVIYLCDSVYKFSVIIIRIYNLFFINSDELSIVSLQCLIIMIEPLGIFLKPF